MMTRTLRSVTRRPYIRLTLVVTLALAMAGVLEWRVVRAQATSSVIKDENALPGNTDWDEDGAHQPIIDAGDPSIQGFATDISVNAGQTVHFKISTDATAYTIDIYRLGYYRDAGTGVPAGARRVVTISPSAALPQGQPACDSSDTASGLYDCGSWLESAHWDVPSGAVSGIYLAKLTRTDGSNHGASHIPFIVRNDGRKADIVVQTSDTTWQAYNRYGGASLYCAPTGRGVSNAGIAYESIACPNRAAKVSYNRPFSTRTSDPQSFLFNAEYPMVRWLESNGYDVKYISGVDTDRLESGQTNPAVPKILTGANKPKVFMSSGHDEYWSGGQRTSVEAARDAGVNLAFFSGNEMFWKVRYDNSYRTLIGYKETLLNGGSGAPAVDNVWTGSWRDPRQNSDGGRPENGLTGTIFTVNDGTTGISIPPAMSNFRLWRNTAIAGVGGSLANGTLGYEWDEDLDNGARPNGIVHLSSTTVAVPQKIQDYGGAFGPGTATHSLTMYRASSGALVFGAGTVQWAWGLDFVHDRGNDAPDVKVKQATVNLLADMGAQPTSLELGLSAANGTTDTVAPASTITSPGSGASITSGAPVTITGTASDGGGGVVASVQISVDGGATWRDAQGTASWSYVWMPPSIRAFTILSRAIDDSGNVQAPPSSVQVTVVAGGASTACPCTSIWQATDAPGLANANDGASQELGVKFKSDVAGFITGIRFYKGPMNTGTHTGSLWSANGVRLATAIFSSTAETPSGWQQVNFDTPVPIAANTMYVASYHTNVGQYSFDGAYFATSGHDSAPLHALSSVLGGGNGVFKSGTTTFPVSSFNNANYWVDVVFAETIANANQLTISNIQVQVLDGSNAVVSWTTNKDTTSRIDYTTDPMMTQGLLNVTDGNFVQQHSMRLSGLLPMQTYFASITAVDHNGANQVAFVSNFTLPGPTLHDTSIFDFKAGTTGPNTYASQSGDGEVTLAPQIGAEFEGPGLPAGWVEAQYSPNGFSVIDNGVLMVDGARVATCMTDSHGACIADNLAPQPVGNLPVGQSVEFSARFSGDQFQHAGFAQLLNSGSEPWALFSTLSGGQMYARTNANGTQFDFPLGPSYLGAFHRYRIDWKASSVDYYVDSALVHSEPVAVTGMMRLLAASDLDPAGGVVFVDWMRLGPRAAAGTFTSRAFDSQVAAGVDWNTIQWTANAPAGTTLAISVRTSNDNSTWTAFAPMPAPGPLTLHSRYIQYRVDMTGDTINAPDLDDIIITTDHAPVAVNDSVSTPVNTPLMTNPALNDTDADFDLLTVTAITQPSHGTATQVGSAVRYVPASNYTGPDSFTYTVSDGLLSATGQVSITVNPVVTTSAPTITWANPAAITYGTPLGAAQLNATASSSSSPVPGSFGYAPPAGTILPAGDNLLQVTFTPNDLTHYTVTVALAHIMVNQKPASVSPAAASKTYGGADPTLSGTLSGFLAADNVTASYSRTAGNTVAGNPYTISATLSPASALGNYAITSTTASFTISAAPLTAKADNKTKTFGAALPPLTVSYTGFVNGDTVAAVTTPVLASTAATATSPVGTYPITASGGVAPNYSFVYQPGTLTVTAIGSATALTSSNNPSLFGVPITLKATVSGSSGVATGTVTFKDGTATIGTGTLSAGAATLTTSTLAVGSHSLTAVYGGDGNFAGSTSAALTETISPSAKLQVTFKVRAILDSTAKPKVQDVAVPNALVRVYSEGDACTSTLKVSDKPKKWGLVFDGVDGPGGTDPGCPALTVGSYRAEATTDVNGQATIIVPPTKTNPNQDWIIVGRTMNFDYINTPVLGDPLYSQDEVANVLANQTKAVSLNQIAPYGGGVVAAKKIVELGTELDIITPEDYDWIDDTAKYPFVLVADGDWGISTTIAPPSGFVPDMPTITTTAADATTTAIQFTLTDVGSDWTQTNVTHVINHKGGTRVRTDSIRMFNRKKTKAKSDFATVDPNSAGNAIDVLSNDNVAPPKTLTITAVTQGANGSVSFTGTGVSYTPNPGFVGRDSFTYTVDDGNGGIDTGTVNVRVNTRPSIVIGDISVPEGNVGTSTAAFTVTLSSAIEVPVVFDYATADATGIAGTDYVYASGTAVIPAGQTTVAIPVQVIGDTVFANNRQFKLLLSNVVNKTAAIFGGAAKATIVDDDPKPSISAADAAVVEGNSGSTMAVVTVTLTGATALPATVNYATADGTATAGTDYIAASGTLTFQPGETVKTVPVTILGDTTAESTESFLFTLSGATNASIGVAKSNVTIIDDDSTAWVNTSVADFASGTVDAGTYVSRTNNGEVILAPALGTEFQGKSLQAGWTSTVLAPNGAVAVSTNTASIDGASVVGGGAFSSGRSLEFTGQFSGAAGQWAGLTANGSLQGGSYAVFGAKAANTLVVRSFVSGTPVETAVAGYKFAQAHKFRIDWNANTIVYSIDDKLVASQTVAIGQTMQPTALDTTVGDGALQLSYMRLTPYAASGTYTSAVFDAGAVVTWMNMGWTSTVPAGTTAVVSYRSGNTPTPDGTWTAFTPVPASGAIGGSSRYLQFSIRETTSDAGQTPVVKDVTTAFVR
jgi:hypothetical protein